MKQTAWFEVKVSYDTKDWSGPEELRGEIESNLDHGLNADLYDVDCCVAIAVAAVGNRPEDGSGAKLSFDIKPYGQPLEVTLQDVLDYMKILEHKIYALENK